MTSSLVLRSHQSLAAGVPSFDLSGLGAIPLSERILVVCRDSIFGLSLLSLVLG